MYCHRPAADDAGSEQPDQEYGLKTVVSLNSIMVDGTGMCGCCRVTVGGETSLPVLTVGFDGHLVDFEEMAGGLFISPWSNLPWSSTWETGHRCSCVRGGEK